MKLSTKLKIGAAAIAASAVTMSSAMALSTSGDRQTNLAPPSSVAMDIGSRLVCNGAIDIVRMPMPKNIGRTMTRGLASLLLLLE
jgi:hypothetical protein